MSTKCSMAWGDGFHFYKEVMEEDGVYLELSTAMKGVDFSASPGFVTVRIPLEIWEVIRTMTCAELGLVEKTDEELRQKAEKEVNERIQRVKEAREAGRKSLFDDGPFDPFGSVDDPVEEQVEKAFRYYAAERQSQKEFKARVDAMMPKRKGAHDIVMFKVGKGEDDEDENI